MKSNQKITRVQLKISHDNEFIMIGLVSTEPDYKLSLNINKKINISLRNSTPVKVSYDDENELFFSRFSDQSRNPEVVFSLYSNRSSSYFLLKKLRNVDYIFLIHNPEKSVEPEELIVKLKEIETINAVFHIDLNIFKDKNLQYLIQ